MVFDYKLSFRSCTDEDKWSCASGDCGSESVELNIVDKEDREWCQREGVMTREVSSNSLFQLRSVTRQLKQQIQQNATDLIAFTQWSNLYVSLDKNIRLLTIRITEFWQQLSPLEEKTLSVYFFCCGERNFIEVTIMVKRLNVPNCLKSPGFGGFLICINGLSHILEMSCAYTLLGFVYKLVY